MRIKVFDRMGNDWVEVSLRAVLSHIYPNGKDGGFNPKEAHYISEKQDEFLQKLGESIRRAVFCQEREWHGAIKIAHHEFVFFIEDEGPTYEEANRAFLDKCHFTELIEKYKIDTEEDDSCDFI